MDAAVDGLDIRLLGPVEIWLGGHPVELGPPQLRLLVAVLADQVGRPVTTERLIDRLWAEAPDGARHTLHVQVSRVRNVLERLGGGDDRPRLVRRSGAYVLEADPSCVDVHRVRHALLAGRDSAVTVSDRLLLLREARGLWRGEPLANLPGPWAARTREALRRDHLDLTLVWGALELAHGAPEAVVGPVADLMQGHPYVEPLAELMMRALAETGQPAEALEVYSTMRRRLRDELGADPGARLQDLQQSILAGTVSPATGQRVGVAVRTPSLLPADVAGFSGRDFELAALVRLLTPGALSDDIARTAVKIATVSGVAGVGKTALAVHFGHTTRTEFPDGQLYVNLQGARSPLGVPEVLSRFLRALGVEGTAVPEDVEERAGLYRASLAGRRVLVVLDDGLNEAQIRPLLPGDPGCAVLVTSRSGMPGLEGAARVGLDVLEPNTALSLLAEVAGADRVGAELADAVTIVSRCGRLPLAIRIAGARLAARPQWTLAHLAGRLADERHRLDELTAGDLEVRASLALSYDGLPERQQQAFRRLGLLDAPSFPGWVCAAVLDLPPDEGEAMAETLVDVHLLESDGQDLAGQTRYRLHDLLRVYARERAQTDDPPAVRREALDRVFGGWLSLVEQADARLPSPTLGTAAGSAARWPAAGSAKADGSPGPVDALTWFDIERPALVSAVEQACELGLDELAWGLAHTLLGFFASRGHLDVWRHTHELALAACVATGNRRGQAYMCRGLGQQLIESDELDGALGWLSRAVPLFEELGDQLGIGYTLIALGYVHRLAGRPVEALTTGRRALAVLTAIHDVRGEAYALQSLGVIHRERGSIKEAEQCLVTALEKFGATRDRRFEAYTMRSLGLLLRGQDRTAEAAALFKSASSILQTLGDRYGQASLLQDLGEVEQDPDRAHQLMEEALQLALEIHNQFVEARCLRGLGVLHHDLGELELAEDYLGRSLLLWKDLRMPLYAARSQDRLGRVQEALGRWSEAQDSWREALAVFRRLGAPEAEPLAERLAAADRATRARGKM